MQTTTATPIKKNLQRDKCVTTASTTIATKLQNDSSKQQHSNNNNQQQHSNDNNKQQHSNYNYKQQHHIDNNNIMTIRTTTATPLQKNTTANAWHQFLLP